MTADLTYRALFRRICEVPGDTTALLILADWLEEHGDPHGEFIRTQCRIAELEERIRTVSSIMALAHCTSDLAYFDELYRELEPLRSREGELLTFDNIDQWGWHSFWLRNTTNKTEFDALHRQSISGALICRGFPAIITCTLADWVGEPCERCVGWGGTENAGSYGYGWQRCPACSGAGCFNGHGPAIVLAAPIEEVRLSDRTPSRIGPNPIVEWHREQPGETLFGDDLPSVLFDLLPASGRGDGWACTGGTAMAMEILSTAALTWARQQAGLPVWVPAPRQEREAQAWTENILKQAGLL